MIPAGARNTLNLTSLEPEAFVAFDGLRNPGQGFFLAMEELAKAAGEALGDAAVSPEEKYAGLQTEVS